MVEEKKGKKARFTVEKVATQTDDIIYDNEEEVQYTVHSILAKIANDLSKLHKKID